MGARVTAVHGRQHRVGARLHGQMQRRHERSQLREPLDHPVGEVLRMARGEAQPLDARGVERVEHRVEARRAVQVAPVGVHVLPKQRDLLHAGRHVALGLGRDILQRARFLASAHVGHDAVGAEVVAADGDGQPRRPIVLARRRQLGGKRRGGVEHLHLMAALLDGRFDQTGKRAEVVRAEDHVEMRQFLDELLAVALADAASHGDDALRKRRARAQRHVFERGHLAVQARVGRLAHAAGHERHDVGVFDRLDRQRAKALEHAGDALGIVLVHLASERADAEREVRERGLHGRVSGRRRAVLSVDHDVGERRDADDLDADGRQEPARYGDGLHRLVHRACADGLYLHAHAVLHHAGDGARNRRGRRLRRNLQAADVRLVSDCGHAYPFSYGPLPVRLSHAICRRALSAA